VANERYTVGSLVEHPRFGLGKIVEILGNKAWIDFRDDSEDAKERKFTMDTYWVPGVNQLGTHGRWAFAELRDVYEIESDFEAKVAAHFDEMIERAAAGAP